MMGLDYTEPLYRPPSEANSLIFQVCLGCPNNTCHFCGMYKKRRYREKSLDEIKAEIKTAASLRPDTRRVFLADGDVFNLPYDMLSAVLKQLNNHFPLLTRVGAYSNGSSILKRTDDELRRLKDLKLGIGYLGLESGSDKVLRDMNKNETAEGMVGAVGRAQNAGIKMSVMVLLGLGGPELTREHAHKTAEALNRMQPRFLSALTVLPKPGTRFHARVTKGQFTMLSVRAVMLELREMVFQLELEGTIFRSNHVSNAFPLAGRFPKDKEKLLAEIDFIILNLPADMAQPDRPL